MEINFSKDLPEKTREACRKLIADLVAEHGEETAKLIINGASRMMLEDIPAHERRQIDEAFRRLGKERS